MKKGVIDRLEGNYAIIEIEGKLTEFPRDLLPIEAKEGDTILINGDKILIDDSETQGLHQKLKSLMEEVWED